MENQTVLARFRQISGSLIIMSSEQFTEILQKARREFEENPVFQQDIWKWTGELDENGFFIFCYLLEDYNQQLLTLENYETTVYTLSLLKTKLTPENLENTIGFSKQQQFQLLFNLYEALKIKSMDWNDCENFIKDQIKALQIERGN